MVLADGAAHGKKKKLEWVEGPLHPSIEEIISQASNWVASRNLKGVSPPGSYKSATGEWAIIIPLGRWSGPQNLKSQKNVRSFTAGLCPDTLICLL